MSIRHCSSALALALSALLYGPVAGAASGPEPQPVVRQTWTALGGDLGFMWNVDLLRDYGIALKGEAVGANTDTRGFVAVPLRDQGGLSFAVSDTNFDHFTTGGSTRRSAKSPSSMRPCSRAAATRRCSTWSMPAARSCSISTG